MYQRLIAQHRACCTGCSLHAARSKNHFQLSPKICRTITLSSVTRIIALLCHPTSGVRNLFMCTYVTDAEWATVVANGVRESIVSEAAKVEEENGADGEQDVAGAIATLSVTVRLVHAK